MDDVEKVARAIYNAEWADGHSPVGTWEATVAEDHDYAEAYRTLARAAISSLQTPTVDVEKEARELLAAECRVEGNDSGARDVLGGVPYTLIHCEAALRVIRSLLGGSGASGDVTAAPDTNATRPALQPKPTLSGGEVDPDALTGCADDQTFAYVPVDTIRTAIAPQQASYYDATDHLMHFINALDSESMSGREVRSEIYGECLRMRPSALTSIATNEQRAEEGSLQEQLAYHQREAHRIMQRIVGGPIGGLRVPLGESKP